MVISYVAQASTTPSWVRSASQTALLLPSSCPKTPLPSSALFASLPRPAQTHLLQALVQQCPYPGSASFRVARSMLYGMFSCLNGFKYWSVSCIYSQWILIICRGYLIIFQELLQIPNSIGIQTHRIWGLPGPSELDWSWPLVGSRGFAEKRRGYASCTGLRMVILTKKSHFRILDGSPPRASECIFKGLKVSLPVFSKNSKVTFFWLKRSFWDPLACGLCGS